jgi:FixJ family two-component response regulator
MPEMNGLELLERLRARGATTPAILITGKGDSQLAPRLAAAGIHATLNKPVASEDLFRAIESARGVAA